MATRRNRIRPSERKKRESRPQARRTTVHQQLLDVLKTIDRPGTFCTSGRLPAVLPGLEVAGVGPIALPLSSLQAAELKERAHLAPYGKGTKTLVDTNVRRAWEIDADQMKLANPEWPLMLESALGAVQLLLGLEKQKLSSHLYKLLLYEPGSFFLPHQDGEKLNRMVATLVVVLPSDHKGGELIVRHEGQEEVIDFGGPESRFNTHMAAFYADCEHEIRPLKSGFRLCLTYNLTLQKSKKPITAPSSSNQIESLSQKLNRWQAAATPDRLAVLLDHKYTENGLAVDALKGVDRAKAQILFEAAMRSGCEAYLALVTLWQAGAAEPSDGYGRYGYGHGYDDGEHEMGEVFDESLTAEHFRDFSGKRRSFGTIELREDEIVSQRPLTDEDADEEDFEGYTGNAGMTLERWYHRAAVVIWPGRKR